jgi:thioredoxin-dependent peroxiredoxin
VKKAFLCALVASAIAVPAVAGLKAGATAPNFKAKAAVAGKVTDFTLASALKKGPVVVYFYPAAYTGGCNLEARAFADNAAKFSAAKATIVGVSGDSIARLAEYSADPEYCGGKFAVASDPEGVIGKSYGLNVRKAEGPSTYKDSKGRPLQIKTSIERATFVIAPNGKIVATFSSAEDKVRPAEHAEKSLAAVQALRAKKG